ncbi:unnamed protein product [Cuscuta epithymum]|uniref:Secreted protein n=1 Tax=Cuscuta epithymum TaxID=186058 RepID=A0AAV0CVB8_9ASTE|nr:unnamed protein product [Cuscuta epithymum]
MFVDLLQIAVALHRFYFFSFCLASSWRLTVGIVVNDRSGSRSMAMVAMVRSGAEGSWWASMRASGHRWGLYGDCLAMTGLDEVWTASGRRRRPPPEETPGSGGL